MEGEKNENSRHIWWRRRESNPRPKTLSEKSLRACPVRYFFAVQHWEPARLLNC